MQMTDTAYNRGNEKQLLLLGHSEEDCSDRINTCMGNSS